MVEKRLNNGIILFIGVGANNGVLIKGGDDPETSSDGEVRYI